MKNITINNALNFGKSSGRWLTGYLSLLALMSFSGIFAQQGTVSIGAGTATSANRVPIYSCYNFNYSQQIITASEYAASGGVAGQVTKVSYYYASGGTTINNWNNWTVYLGHTSKTEFASTSDWEPLANLTQVFTGTITPVAGNWFEITFTTPFTYDGTSNLIIAVDENSSGYSCTANFGSYSGASNTGIYYYSDGTNPDPASPPTGTRTSTLARLRFFGAVASCLAPSGLTSSNVGTNSATVSWNAAASATNGYEYYVSNANTAPNETTTPTGSVASGVTTANITGLTSNTDYFVWVRSVCGATTTSSWSFSTSFKTLCDAAAIPYSLDADAASTPAMPDCVTTQNVGTGNNWTTASNPGYGFNGQVFRYAYNSSNAANAWFYTQGLNLTAGTSYRVSYTYGNNSTSYTEKLKVGYGSTAAATGMTIIADYPNITGATATDAFVDFTPATTGTYYIGFNAYSASNQFNLYVDEIAVTVTPTCEPVTDVSAMTTSFTSGEIMWEESASLPADGYAYYVSTDAAAEPVEASVPAGTTAAGTTMAELTGLTPNTTYYVWARAICSATDASPWEGPATFYTGYCIPAPTSVDNDGIINVMLGTINNASLDEPGHYGDYTAQSTNAAVASTVDFEITYATGYTYGTKIWVDWNNDTDFDDEGELVYTGLSESDNPTTLSGSFDVPADAAVVGSHTLRIGGTDNNSGGSPCYTGSYGTYEDYSINIFMPDPPAITGFTPASYCAASGDITITGTSLGFATLEIGGTAIDITENTDTQIIASVPAGVSGTVAVTTVSGTATTTDVFEVTTPAELTLSGSVATICLGDSTETVTVTEGAADFDTYEWSPSGTVSGNAADGFIFTPEETTSYTLTASQSSGSCVVIVEYEVTVNAVPDPVTVTPAAVNACLGSPVEITATGGASIIAAEYCVPTVSSTGATGDYINNFTIADLENLNSGDAASDYTYYDDMTANVVAGQAYDVTVQAGPSWGQRFRVWVDMNMDGEFTEDESIFDTATSTTSLVEGTATIPATAFNGLTRMRVGSRFGSTGIDADEACGHTGYGEWEDYNIMITGGANPVNYVWSPMDGLYTDAAATIAYTGEGVQTVYAMPAVSTTYTATVTNDLGCPASDSAVIDIITTPAPTGDTEAIFTTTATVSDLIAMGDNIQWYTTETGGTPLSADDELTSGTYYATQTQNGCESQERLAVVVTLPEMDWVNLQWPPELTINQGETGDVYAQGYEEGVTPGAGPGIGVTAWIGINEEDTDPSTWTTWIPMTFNTQVGNNDEFMAAIGEGLDLGTYYYASRFQYLEGPYSYGGYSAGGGSFWDGVQYVSGVLTVNCGTMAPVAMETQSFCDEATVADLMATGDAIQWYTTATGGMPMDMSASLTNGTTYYASQTVGCESTTRTAVTITIYETAAPTGNAEQTFDTPATVSQLMATGNDIMWYDAATGGMMLSGTDMLVDGATYYASQTMNSCESQERFAVTVTVNPPVVDYANLQFPSELSVQQGSNGMVYAQVYEPGVTPGSGPGAGITAWIGISEEDTDPSTWTTWIPMTFNTQVGNNDEYVASIGEELEIGTYYYASRFQLMDGPYRYGGYATSGGDFWNGTTSVSGILTVVCNTQAPLASDTQAFCNVATVADLTAQGTDIQWYMDEEGGMPLTADTELTNGMYYASQVNECESINRTAVAVTVSSTPAPQGEASQVVGINNGETATIEDIEITADGDVSWYMSEEDAMAGENAIEPGTAIEEGMTYYAMQTINGCPSLTTLAVTIAQILAGDRFDVASFSYFPNPVKDVLTITYSSDINSVAVFNMLGQQVMAKEPNTAETKLDMSVLSDGTYIVTVTSGTMVKTVKVVKKQ